MKRSLALLLVLMMAASLCACDQKDTKSSHPGTSAAPGASASQPAPGVSQPAPAVSSGKADAGTASLEKQAGDVVVEIAPPDGWARMEGSVLPVHYMKGTASFMVKAEPFTGETLDDVVDEALAIYQKSFGNIQVQGEAEPFTVDEKDARRLTFTCTLSNINMKFLYAYLFAADKTYVITFGDQESTFDALSADYETILSDIRFIAQ